MKKLSFLLITIFLFFNVTYAHEEWTGHHVEDILFELSSYSGKEVHAVGYLMLNKNIEWKDRDVKFCNMEDHLIIFPTTPTRITFNKVWDRETFDYNQGPHNLNWTTLGEHQNPHPWQSEENHTLANLESENFTSMKNCDNGNAHIVESFGIVHPCAFADWRDSSHLKHIIKDVNNVKVYRSRKLPDQDELIHNVKPQGKEQINHLDKKRHIAYWRQLKKLL